MSIKDKNTTPPTPKGAISKKANTQADADIIVLVEKGVIGKGYGHLAKAVMLDPTIELGAKSQYGYLCSYGGQGDGTYLRRSRILEEMGIGEKAYNTYMASLEKRGYIVRTQSRSMSGIYGTTTVELVMIPSHLADQIAAAQAAETRTTLYSGTIYALGYGTMPKLVARDTRLSYKARGVYGYFSVHANTDGEAFPSREKILRDLKITKNSYTKYLKELIDYGYVSVKQLRDATGKLGQTIFTLNAFPEEIVKQREKGAISPCPKNSTTVEEVPNAPCTKKSTTVEPAPEAPCPKNSTTVEAPCPKNSTTVEAPCPNSPCPAEPCPVKSTTVFNITNTILGTNTISLQDRMIDSVREKINFDLLIFGYEREPMAMEAINLLVKAVAKVLSTTNPRVTIGKETIDTRNVCEVLLRINNAATVAVIERYLARTDTVYKPGAYLLKSIYAEILNPTTNVEEEEALEIF